jgi:hypothetical protein
MKRQIYFFQIFGDKAVFCSHLLFVFLGAGFEALPMQYIGILK